MTAAVFKLFAVLLAFALSSKWVRVQGKPLECQTLALELYVFAKPSFNLDCKQSCDERYADLREMPKKEVKGFNLLSSSHLQLKAYADARGIFWIDECVAWLRYCFRQRAAILTIDKNAPVSQQSAGTGPALTCLCRSVFLLIQVRKHKPDGPKFCEGQTLCQRLTGRINLIDRGLWSCKEGKYIKDASCARPERMCPCCRTRELKSKTTAVPCPSWPKIDELMNEPFVLGDQEWLPYDLHGGPQPEEGFPRGTVLVPQGPACPVEQEGPSRFKAASLPFYIFDSSACGQAGLCAARSSEAPQMHSHFEAMSKASERTHQLQECLRPPQKQQKKRKAAAAADASCSISALASIGQSQSDLTTHESQLPEFYPVSFTTLNDGELFFGSQFVSAQTTGGERHSLSRGASGIDADNLQLSQVFAESSDMVAANHPATDIELDNLQFSQYFSAAGSAATTESIPPASQSNPDDLTKDKQDSLNTFEGIP